MHAIRRILVPVDFSPCSREALEVGLSMARSTRATVEVLHVYPDSAQVAPFSSLWVQDADRVRTLDSLAREEATRRLDAFLSNLELPPGFELTKRVESGPEAVVIEAISASADLVVMGTHGRSGLAHLLLGSVAEKVIRGAACPVLTVRASATAIEAEKASSAKPEKPKVVYALFDSAAEVEEALGALRDAQIPLESISVLMSEETADRDFAVLRKTRAAAGAAAGGAIGGTIGGVLGGLTVLGGTVTGGFGLLVMGPAIGFAAAGSLFGGLIGWGIPREEAQRLQDELRAGRALMAVHPGGVDMARRAREILGAYHTEPLEL